MYSNAVKMAEWPLARPAIADSLREKEGDRKMI
jgi:hypothetical protein